MKITNAYQFAFISSLVLALSACETPQQRPQPAPPPPQTPPPSEQQSQTQSQQQQSESDGETASKEAGSPSDPMQSQTSSTEQSESTSTEESGAAPPASNETADVEIVDIPVDENGDPIVDERETAREQASSQSNANSGAGNTPQTQQPASSGGGAPNPTGPATAVNLGAATSAERASKLEQDLAAKLSKFDELMRKAEQDAAAERAATGGGSYAGTPQGAGGRAKPSSKEGDGGAAARSSGLGNTPDRSGSTSVGVPRPPAGPVPVDVANNGRDDDIVARQLREAASRETDPALRDKLWDEYRNYKKGLGR